MTKNTSKVLSFIVGLTTVAVVVGVVINKSPQLRQEMEQQLKGYLDSSRAALKTAQGIISKIQDITGILVGDKEESATKQRELFVRSYEDEWDKHI